MMSCGVGRYDGGDVRADGGDDVVVEVAEILRFTVVDYLRATHHTAPTLPSQCIPSPILLAARHHPPRTAPRVRRAALHRTVCLRRTACRTPRAVRCTLPRPFHRTCRLLPAAFYLWLLPVTHRCRICLRRAHATHLRVPHSTPLPFDGLLPRSNARCDGMLPAGCQRLKFPDAPNAFASHRAFAFVVAWLP